MSNPIRILVVTCCRNEAAILPWFMRHYDFADAIHVWDNNSSDETLDIILEKKNRWGGAYIENHVRHYHYDTNGEIRDDIHMNIKMNHHLMQHGFDWCISVDCDELLWHRDGVREYLQRCADTGITLPRTQGYDMVADEFPSFDDGVVQLHDLIQKGVPSPNYSKFAAFSTSIDLQYSAGCHPHDTRVGGVPAEVFAGPSPAELKLLHYRYWGEQHARDRAKSNKLSAVNISHGWGNNGQNDPDHMANAYNDLKAKRVNVLESAQ